MEDTPKGKTYLKVDDSYLDCVSRFRIAIDQMNSSFVDLVSYFKDDFLESCKNIASINQEFIRNLVTTNELTHFQQFSDILKYYEINDNEKDIKQLLKETKDKIQDRFNKFYSDPNESPFSDSIKGLFLTEKKFESFKKILDENSTVLTESNDEQDPDELTFLDDFMESKIIPLFKNDNYDQYEDNDEDEDDDDDNNNKRYYGNPYLTVPKKVQKATNKYLSFVNSAISIDVILNFQKIWDEYDSKAINQKQKVKKEEEEQKEREAQEKKEAERRKEEKRKEAEKQELISKDIPELKRMKEELENEIKELEEKRNELDLEIQQLEEKKNQFLYDINNPKSDNIDDNSEQNTDNKDFKGQDSETECHIQNKNDEYKNKIILTLLTKLSKIKENFDELKVLSKPK